MTDGVVWSPQKTPRKLQTAPAISSSGVRMATASPTGGNVTGRTTVGTGLTRRTVEVRVLRQPQTRTRQWASAHLHRIEFCLFCTWRLA